ncbi:MAG: alkaline phosphatase family protein, partial [Halanaerobiaceae bacterium]
MRFIKNLFKKKGKRSDHKKGNKKFFVLGLDGVPCSFIEKLVEDNKLPVFNDLMESGQFQRINSVLPTISSVAWSSFMTGEDAGGHNIFGFVDREPDPFNIFIPTANRRKGEVIWERLDQMNKKSIVINVPMTYPPSPINGKLISGFLATDL